MHILKVIGGVENGVRHQRVMITREQVHRHWQALQHLERSSTRLPLERVVLKHIAGDHNTVCIMLRGYLAEAFNGAQAGVVKPRLGFGAQKLPSHAKLQVRGVDKSKRVHILTTTKRLGH